MYERQTSYNTRYGTPRKSKWIILLCLNTLAEFKVFRNIFFTFSIHVHATRICYYCFCEIFWMRYVFYVCIWHYALATPKFSLKVFSSLFYGCFVECFHQIFALSRCWDFFYVRSEWSVYATKKDFLWYSLKIENWLLFKVFHKQ